MKILNREDFMALPENTVFAMYAHSKMGPLCIKGTSTPELDQFLYSEISVALVRKLGEDPLSSLAKAATSGEDIEMDFTTMQCEREVMPRQLFMAWDREDVAALIHRLAECLTVKPAEKKVSMPFYPAVRLAKVGESLYNGYHGMLGSPLTLVDLRYLAKSLAVNIDVGNLGVFVQETNEPGDGYNCLALPAFRASNFHLIDDTLVCDVQVQYNQQGQVMASHNHHRFQLGFEGEAGSLTPHAILAYAEEAQTA